MKRVSQISFCHIQYMYLTCDTYYCSIISCTGYIKDTILPLFHKFFDQSFSNQDGCFKAVAQHIGKICYLLKGMLSVCLFVCHVIYHIHSFICGMNFLQISETSMELKS